MSNELRDLVNAIIDVAERMYGDLDYLNDLLDCLRANEELNELARQGLDYCYKHLNDVEILDEIIARLGSLKNN